MDAVTVLAQAFWIIIPVYTANACAVIVGGGTPIDFGRKWRDGKRILGDGKTWSGLIIGTLLGMIAGFGCAIAASLLQQTDYAFLGLTNFLGFPLMIPILFSLCFGALLGDLVESFFKRRVGIERGADWIPFDQLDFLLGALLLSLLTSTILQITGLTPVNWFFSTITIWQLLVLVVVTPFIHITANLLWRRARHRQRAQG
jgi:CDP-2,3-bis-(O-geranylgeranyl)-sn-glycerol synthase